MAIKSTINFDKVSGGMVSLNTGLGKLKNSSDTIKTASLNTVKIKRESIARNRMLSNMREEKIKLREQESLVEASSPNGAFKRTSSIIGNSTRGFLDRILDFSSSLLLGWLVYNLPTIMTAIEDLIIRIKSLYGVLTGFMSNLTNTFENFGNLLYAVYQNVTQFDFMDHSKRVQTAIDDLNDNFDLMHDQFMEGFDLLKVPLGEGPGEELIPELNTDYTQPAPTTGGGQGGGSKYQELASTIIKGEGGLNSVNRGTAGDTPGGSKSIFGKDLSEVTVGEIMQAQREGKVFAVGKYQFIPVTLAGAVSYTKTPLNAKFNSKTQNKLFDYLIDVKRPEIGAYISGKSNDRRTAIQQLSREFASVGLEYSEAGRSRGQSRYAGSGGNRASISPELAGSALDRQRSSGPALAITSKPQSGKGGNIIEYLTGDRKHKKYRKDHAAGNYHDHFAFINRATRDAAIKLLTSKGWVIGSINTGRHAGDSYHYSNQAFDIPFYPNQSKKGVTDNAKGETILSSRVRADLIAGGFNGSQLGGSLISSPTNKPVQVSSPTSPTQLSPRLFQAQTPRTQQAQVSPTTAQGQNVPSIGNNRRGQQVIIADNPQQPQPQQVSSKSSGGEFEIILAEDSLNSMIKNQILLELAYT
jgi:hypothetical protein